MQHQESSEDLSDVEQQEKLANDESESDADTVCRRDYCSKASSPFNALIAPLTIHTAHVVPKDLTLDPPHVARASSTQSQALIRLHRRMETSQGLSKAMSPNQPRVPR